MKVSIITSTYNSASTLRDTLQSVASQSHKAVEHIIIDGLSTDTTLDTVKEFPQVAKVSRSNYSINPMHESIRN